MDDFEQFFRASYPRVVRTLTITVGSRDRAEELAQEAFARAFRRWRVVRRADRPEAWVIVVAMNVERRRWNRAGKEASRAPAPERESADPADVVVTSLTTSDALGLLSPRQRAVVVLRYLADLPFAQVADALGMTEGTARATLHQALTRLRVELAEGDA